MLRALLRAPLHLLPQVKPPRDTLLLRITCLFDLALHEASQSSALVSVSLLPVFSWLLTSPASECSRRSCRSLIGGFISRGRGRRIVRCSCCR